VLHFLQDGLGDLGIETGPALFTQLETAEKRERVLDRHLGDIPDALPRHQHRETFGTQPPAPAGGTGLLDHEGFELFARRVRLRLLISPLDVLQHAAPPRLVRAVEAGRIPLIGERLAGNAVENRLASRRWEIAPRSIEAELERLRQRREDHLPYISGRFTPGENDPLENRKGVIAHHQVLVHLALRAEARAGRTGTKG